MRRRSPGFTLIEIAVAISILGVGVVTLQQVYQGSLRLQNRAGRQSMAVFRARAAIDRLLAEPLKERGDCQTADSYKVCSKVALAGPEDGGGENADDPGFSESDLRLYALEVDVTWQDGGADKTYEIRTLRAAAAPED